MLKLDSIGRKSKKALLFLKKKYVIFAVALESVRQFEFTQY